MFIKWNSLPKQEGGSDDHLHHLSKEVGIWAGLIKHGSAIDLDFRDLLSFVYIDEAWFSLERYFTQAA